MADAKAPEQQPQPPNEQVDIDAAQQMTSWVFFGEPPTPETIREMLAELPDVWETKPVNYADYLQLLPQNTKMKVRKPHPTQEGKIVEVDEYVETWTAYFSVAGRIKMVNDAQVLNDWWSVDFEPESFTQTGAAGYVILDDRIVYREHCVIHKTQEQCLGRRPGTAWVPAKGGSQAAGSNPFEKVETAARGRALAAWGFGVLPGSGVASVEEMQSIKTNGEAQRGRPQDAGGAAGTGKSRDELLEAVKGNMESIRQRRGQSDEESKQKVAKYLADIGVRGKVYDEGKNEIDWSIVKDGQLVLLGNMQRDVLVTLQSQDQPV